MSIFELITISISIAMDAFSASICKGLNEKKLNLKNCFTVGSYFGIFQSIMPTIGFYLGSFFSDKIKLFDHYFAFFMLSFIGLSMINDSKNNINSSSIKCKEMIFLSIATSIDALIVGITFAFLKVNLLLAILLIGLITFFICGIGYLIGTYFGNKYQKKSQIIGGIILIIMGLKILIEHLL